MNSDLRQSYANCEPEMLERDLFYLCQLSGRAAFEIDEKRLGNSADFSHLNEFAGILAKYQLKDTDGLILHYPAYFPLWKAMNKDSGKKITKTSELALEMKLLRAELENIPSCTDSVKLQDMISFLCSFSNEALNGSRSSGYLKRAA